MKADSNEYSHIQTIVKAISKGKVGEIESAFKSGMLGNISRSIEAKRIEIGANIANLMDK